MRRAPTTGDLHHLYLADGEEEEERERTRGIIGGVREVRNGKEVRHGVVSSDEFSSA